MGHHDGAMLDRQYRLLQRRLDRWATGAPDSPVLQKILRSLFPPDDVELASRLPCLPTPLDQLSKRLEEQPSALAERLTAMAQRGLVIDLEHEGQRYFCLAPLVLGFFEFTFMRVRDDIPQAELARLFEQYMLDVSDGGIYQAVFQKQTQIGRTQAHEEAIADESGSEILDWERASHVVQTADTLALSLCACRHKASHLGRACERPQEVCLTLNYGARHLIRAGFGREITAAEGMRVLEESKAAGLVQIADNVQRRVHYLCNCCGCCCEMFRAVKIGNIRGAITSSNWVARVDHEKCNGCGNCLKACPLGVIHLVPGTDGLSSKQHGVRPDFRAQQKGQAPFVPSTLRAAAQQMVPVPCPKIQSNPPSAVCDAEACIGCGVCHAAYPRGAIGLEGRPKRTIAPETIFDRLVLMAIERGRLADLIFDQPGGLGWRAVGRIVAMVEKTSLMKAMMAIEPLRSVFLRRIVHAARNRVGRLGEVAD